MKKFEREKTKPSPWRRPGSSLSKLSLQLDPGQKHSRMTFFLSVSLVFIFSFSACKSTYDRTNIRQDVMQLAEKEYGLFLDVEEYGSTINVLYWVDNLTGEMFATDQLIWKNIENILMVLRRVTLSMDDPPEFFVVDVVDRENPAFRFIFTRYVPDVRKVMAEAISTSHYFDSMVVQIAIGDKKHLFEVDQMDFSRLLVDSIQAELNAETGIFPEEYRTKEIIFSDFLADVAAKRVRRKIKDKKYVEKNFILRQVKGEYKWNDGDGQFRILLDLVAIPGIKIKSGLLEKKLLPMLAKEARHIFKVYKFSEFSSVTIFEKNSGIIHTLSRK